MTMGNQTASLKAKDKKHVADVQGGDILVNYTKLFDIHIRLLGQKHLKYPSRM